MKKFLVAAAALMLAACSGGGAEKGSSVVGDWTVDGAKSRVAFGTVKNTDVGESHKFKTVSGSVKGDGSARFVVDLASVDTHEETRDGRMKEHLFEIAKYPEAVITAKLTPADYESLAIDQRVEKPILFDLDFHGVKATEVEANVFVTRISDNEVLVETAEPIQISGDDFNLLPGLAKLQELAKAKAITPVAPVTFSIVLKRG